MSLRDEQILSGEIDGELPAARRAELEASNAEILEALPPAMVAAEIERRLARARREPARRRGAWTSGALGVAVAVAVLVLFWQRSGGGGDAEISPEIVRIKGDPQLAVFREEGSQIRRLSADTPVAAGDRLQLSYHAASARHGVILSVDGRGVVTLHHPAAPEASTTLDHGGPVALDFAYKLDDAPAFERFFFITSASPIDAAATVRAVERWAASERVRPATDPPPTRGRVRSLLLRKADSP